jgi:mannose-6-phosphate isomerase-like protein (cupin superfamily)
VAPRDRVQVLDADIGPTLGIVEGPGDAVAIVWPGMGSRLRSLHRLSLREGARTVTLEHPGEAVYYVLAGEGEAIGAGKGGRLPISEGEMVHIGPDTPYAFAARGGGIELIGGPSPPDPAVYGAITEEPG